MTVPNTAMVLAAGLGTRMRPLTDDRPKALVEVAGQALIDHVLRRLGESGVERAELLETGGGLKKAHSLLGDEPVFVANIDSVWMDRGDAPWAEELVRLWDPVKMDACLLLATREGAIGFEGDGDFFLAADGKLTFRGEAPSAPYAYMGVHITRPDYADGGPEGPFSLSPLWRASAAAGRLYGCVLDGDWMHVGDPQARDEAEARLAE